MLKVRAFDSGHAEPYRQRRHVHVSSKAFVIAYVQMAGEPFSLWGAFVGRAQGSPPWIGAVDPRNRDLQSAGFEELAQVLNENVRKCWDTEDEPLQVCPKTTPAWARTASRSSPRRISPRRVELSTGLACGQSVTSHAEFAHARTICAQQRKSLDIRKVYA